MTVQYLYDSRARFSCLPRTWGGGDSPSPDKVAESGSPPECWEASLQTPTDLISEGMARLNDFRREARVCDVGNSPKL